MDWVIHPFINYPPPPHYHLPTIYFKNFHSLPIIQLSSFLDPLTPIYKMGEGESNYDDIVQRGSKFWLPSPEGGICKIKKRGWKYGAGIGILKRRGWLFSYLIFSRFIIIFTFRSYFTLRKIVLCVWRKIIVLSPKY